MGDFLRLSPWSVSAQARAQDVENAILRLGFVVVVFLEREKKKHYSCTLYFSLIIVKSLQLRGRRKIAEPRKYCLVRVNFFFTLWHVFSLFCFSQVGNSG